MDVIVHYEQLSIEFDLNFQDQDKYLKMLSDMVSSVELFKPSVLLEFLFLPHSSLHIFYEGL